MRKRIEQFVSEHWLNAEPWHYHVYRLPLMFLSLVFILGVLLGLRWHVNPDATPTGSQYSGINWALAFWYLSGCLAVVAAGWCFFRQMKSWASLLALVALLLLGIGHGLRSQPVAGDSLSNVATSDWQPCAIQAIVTEAAVWQPNPNHRPRDPQSSAWKTRWEVSCLAIRDFDQWQPIHARCTLSTLGRIDQFLPGDEIEILGHYRRITSSSNPGGFDFAHHSSLESKFVMLRTESAEQLRKLRSHWGRWSIARCRGIAIRSIDHTLHRWVSCGQSTLAAALVFGQRQQVDWQDQQQLMATGTLHMLAISGMHVEIIASILFGCCLILGASEGLTFGLLVITTWAYAELSGLQPPVVRAAVQVTIFALARWLGAKARLGNLLGAAAFVVVASQASNLANVGVQLSFLAVAAIGLFVSAARPARKRDRLQAMLDEVRPNWQLWRNYMFSKLWEAMRLSWWICIFTCPLIWSNFNVLTPIAVPLNIIISLPVSIGLVAGLLTGLFGWLPPLAWLLGHLCGGALWLVSRLVELAYHLPWSCCWLPAPSLWWTTLFYGLALVWLAIFGRRYFSQLATILLLWIVLGIVPWLAGPRGHAGNFLTSDLGLSKSPLAVVHRELRCTFLNVGHGTSVVLELPSGEVWLYDAGHLGSEERSHQEIASALWHLGTARLDRLILSHADADHYNAALGLLERFSIGEIVSTRHFWGSTDPEIQTLIEGLKRYSGNHQSWTYPHQEARGDVALQVLHPSLAWQGANDNANSLCLQVEYARTRILLPGDLEGAGLLHLVTLPQRPCQIVMAPHHGSMTHDPTQLLLWCQPTVVVISGGARACRPEVVERYSQVPSQLAITHRDGAIQIRIDPMGDSSVWRWAGNDWTSMP